MLYEVIARGSYFGNEIVNRWNYVRSGVPAAASGSFGLAYAMGFIPDGVTWLSGTVFSYLRGMSDSNVHWDAIQVRAAADYDVEDFYEVPYPTPIEGLISVGEASSPVLAFGFRTNLVRLDIGRGYKRFVGVAEGAVADGGVIASDYVTPMANLAAAMSEVLTYDDEGNTLSYSPCVVSKLEYTTPSGKKAYKYYSTLALQMEHVALGIQWVGYNTVRSQRSRQYGHGS